MTCEQSRANIDALIDGELSDADAVATREHLATCDDCAARHRRHLETVRLAKDQLMRYSAPDVLKARIRASLTAEAPVKRTESPAGAGRPSWWRRRSMPGWGVAAAIVVAALAGGGVTAGVLRREATGSVADAVLASHIRSLMPGHLTDIASTDQHNVKPWFNGRASISPPVPRLDSAGFVLIGGRLDYVDGRAVPSVVYTRRQHVINVFIWPASGRANEAEMATTRNGYHLLRSYANGDELWFVSDLNADELRQFETMFERAARE
jgi:anti-sigma factor RsiW